MSALQKQVVKSRLPPVTPRNVTGVGSSRAKFRMKREYTPVSWNKYYTEKKDVEISPGNIFRVYRAGSSGPLILLLHGGGYSGLTWSLFSDNICDMVQCQIASVDLRGHGETVTKNDLDLSAETLSDDVGAVFKALFPEDNPPPTVLIGHSMGGAVAVHTAHKELISSLIGLIVIDVVEGTAMEALQSMQTFLRSRPSSFSSLEYAIEWCVRSGQVRNLDSARVSMPSQLKNSITGEPSTKEITEAASEVPSNKPESAAASGGPSVFRSDSIPEEEEENSDLQIPEPAPFKRPSLQTAKANKYTWRIDLSKTEEYWTGWFAGLSSLFLSISVPKLLLLAGVDRLDRDLTIGQMQGKFQMQVLPQCGHAVHEDVPDKVAEAVATFLVRNKFTEPTSNFHRTFPAC